MSAEQNRAIGTQLDAVCLMGILWQLDLLEYGQRLINEGFEDLETLSAMTDRDFQKMRFKVNHAKRLRSFARRAGEITDIVPANRALPLSSWGQSRVKSPTAHTLYWSSPRVAAKDEGTLDINSLNIFFKERASRAKPDRKRAHDDTDYLSARPLIRQIVTHARELALVWVEPSPTQPTSHSLYNSSLASMDNMHHVQAQTSYAPTNYTSSAIISNMIWAPTVEQMRQPYNIPSGPMYTSGTDLDYAMALASPDAHYYNGETGMDLTDIDLGASVGPTLEQCSAQMSPYYYNQQQPFELQQQHYLYNEVASRTS